MPAVKSIGPQVLQLVIYNDATYGPIAALITQASGDAAGSGISLTTFPPGVAPQTQSGVQYDYTGAIVGRWRYRQVDVE